MEIDAQSESSDFEMSLDHEIEQNTRDGTLSKNDERAVGQHMRSRNTYQINQR